MRSIIALAIIGCVIVGTAGFGIFGVRKVKMDPTQFIVGGRSLGAIFLWLLMAGEVYTSFTFLGAAGGRTARELPPFISSVISPLPAFFRSFICRRFGGPRAGTACSPAQTTLL
jgi:Na+/proline symporter